MPIYSYRCDHCGVQFDQSQKFSDEPLKICPECGEEKLRKLYLPVGIVFKGSGFYSTDHRSPSGQTSSPKHEKAEKSEKTESSTSPENAGKTKSESKKSSSRKEDG
jgi:putative FmdB family regulatory protein